MKINKEHYNKIWRQFGTLPMKAKRKLYKAYKDMSVIELLIIGLNK